MQDKPYKKSVASTKIKHGNTEHSKAVKGPTLKEITTTSEPRKKYEVRDIEMEIPDKPSVLAKPSIHQETIKTKETVIKPSTEGDKKPWKPA